MNSMSCWQLQSLYHSLNIAIASAYVSADLNSHCGIPCTRKMMLSSWKWPKYIPEVAGPPRPLIMMWNLLFLVVIAAVRVGSFLLMLDDEGVLPLPRPLVAGGGDS